MQMILNNIPKKQVPHLKALFNSLSFIAPGDVITRRSEKEIFLDELEESARQVKAYMRGEIELRSAQDLINEMRAGDK
jgi:hypothetical protein